jgi:L-aspartate oxidase
VWLDFSPIPKEKILNHFPNIYKHCTEAGFNPLKTWVPVVPAQHYFMGGIYVDKDSRTTMNQLYAIGETSCNGVHGRNRLASNSLLESLVFAKRAAADIIATKEFKKAADFDKLINMDDYEDLPGIMKKYHEMVVEEIKEEARLRALKEEAV